VFEIDIPLRLVGLGAPRVALVLGSGFGGLASMVEGAVRTPYSEIEGFPQPAAPVQGHAGELIAGTLAGVQVVVFSGRVHCYQGASAREAAYPARLAHALGCQTLIVTNASGGINTEFGVGDVVLLADQMNLTGDSSLVGWSGPPGGVPFVPMRDAYDPGLRRVAREVAAEQGLLLQEGVYAGLLGPAFETPAEVGYLRSIGADVVGMSTVHEVIAARALGLQVLGFSLVTNAAAGVGLSHTEVLEAGRVAAQRMETLMIGILSRLP